MLSFLIENRERVVSKDEIIGKVWDGRAISDSALNTRMNAARKAVGDDGKAQSVIRTFPRRGFRFVAEVVEDGSAAMTATSFGSRRGKPSIAVLPFENLSGDLEQEYFSDGITADIITALSHVRQFMVIARDSSFTYRGAVPDIRQVAQDMGVRYVLNGSVRKSGERIRVSALLVDGSSGEYVWADRYDRQLEDLFTLQDEIAQTIAGNIEPTLAKAEAERAIRRSAGDPDAWDFLQRGIYHWHRHTKEDFHVAVDWLEKAIEAGPDTSAPYAILSQIYFLDSIWRFSNTPGNAAELALSYGRQAVTLDREDANSHTSLGRAMMGRAMSNGQFEETISNLRFALGINPNSALAHYILGRCLVWIGDLNSAKEHLELAMRLSPRDPAIGLMLASIGEIWFSRGDYDGCVAWMEKAALALPNLTWPARSELVAALAHLGRFAEAKSEYENLLRVAPEFVPDWVRNNFRVTHQNEILNGLAKLSVISS